MGTVSGAALAAGGEVTGVVPYAMVVAGGERGQVGSAGAGADHATYVALTEKGREKVRSKSVYLRAVRWHGRRLRVAFVAGRAELTCVFLFVRKTRCRM